MKHIFLSLIAVSGLAACAAVTVPTPEAMRLTDTTMSLFLNTGEICRVEWRAAPQGQLCGFSYSIADAKSANLLGRLVGGGKGLIPQAVVSVTSPAGVPYEFESPVNDFTD
ncbi:MAG: hypothetical protein ACOH2M_09960 [Cypionkella sp.]